MHKISPFLWFDGQAEQAAKFYTSIFKKSKVLQVSRYGESGPGEPGSVMVVSFEILGQKFMALNGGPDFRFNKAISFMVYCKDQKEIDYYWDKLSKGGKKIQCGWLDDKFGLSWQIVPEELGKLIGGDKTGAVMKAVMGMQKLDLAKLRRAAGKKG